jgi:hypothetical protein
VGSGILMSCSHFILCPENRKNRQEDVLNFSTQMLKKENFDSDNLCNAVCIGHFQL